MNAGSEIAATSDACTTMRADRVADPVTRHVEKRLGAPLLVGRHRHEQELVPAAEERSAQHGLDATRDHDERGTVGMNSASAVTVDRPTGSVEIVRPSPNVRITERAAACAPNVNAPTDM